MPHAFFKDFKSNLSAFVAANMGKLQAMAIQKVQKEIFKVLEKLQKECPPPEELDKLTRILSGARTAVNGISLSVNKLEPLPKKLDPIIIGGTIIIEILSHLPVPSTIGTPPGPAGGVIFSETKGQSTARAAKLENARRLVQSVSDDKKSIEDILGQAKGVFDPIKAALDAIQKLIDACYANQDLSDEERKALIDTVQGKGAPEDNTIGYPYRSSSGRDYTIKIITDPNSPAIAPKRQAIVEDFRGITVLTGPSSFASRTQVLIDEIKFRIENQLP